MKFSDYLTVTRDTMNAYYQMCQPVLTKYDIPQVSFDILMFLTNNPEHCTAQDISEIRGIKKNLVSVHVEKLFQAGLLSRGAVEGDRRKVALSCTERAEPIIKEGIEMQLAFIQMLFDGVGETEWDAYRNVMEVIAENIKVMTQKIGSVK